MTDVVRTRSQAIRNFWNKHPTKTAAEVAQAIHTRNPRFDYQKLRDLANVIASRKRRREALNGGQLDCSPDLRGVVKRSEVRGVKRGGVAHQWVYGTRVMPAALWGAVVVAAHAGWAGWRVSCERTGQLHCEMPGTKYRMVAYESTGELTVYAGHGLPDFEDLSLNVLVHFDGVIRKWSRNGADAAVLATELHEMSVFLDRLWREPSFHLPIWVEGIEKVGPFVLRIKERGLTIRHDGSDLRCLELEFTHVPIAADVNVAVREALQSLVPQVVALSVGEAMKSFGPQFGGEFGKQFGEAFASKFGEMLGVPDRRAAQRPLSAAEERRYS